MSNNVTRGYGFLERFLSGQRAKMANNSIPDDLRSGKILDLGCGFYPYFLSTVKFKEKFGLNSVFSDEKIEGLNLVKYDFHQSTTLPFADSFFNVVTMLAVAEHLEPEVDMAIFGEVNRVLAPGGRFIITVPWGKADGLLKLLSKIKIVSAVEINEHQQFYSKKLIKKQLLTAGFSGNEIKVKRFELGLNLFILVKK